MMFCITLVIHDLDLNFNCFIVAIDRRRIRAFTHKHTNTSIQPSIYTARSSVCSLNASSFIKCVPQIRNTRWLADRKIEKETELIKINGRFCYWLHRCCCNFSYISLFKQQDANDKESTYRKRKKEKPMKQFNLDSEHGKYLLYRLYRTWTSCSRHNTCWSTSTRTK